MAADLGAAKGFPIDLALEAISYHELWSQGAGDAPLNVWYHALNNGFKVPVVGGEDSISNLHRVELVASVRSYFYLTRQSLVGKRHGGIVEGPRIVTNGPLIEFTAGQSMPGERFASASGADTFRSVLIHCAHRTRELSNGRSSRRFPSRKIVDAVFDKALTSPKVVGTPCARLARPERTL